MIKFIGRLFFIIFFYLSPSFCPVFWLSAAATVFLHNQRCACKPLWTKPNVQCRWVFMLMGDSSCGSRGGKWTVVITWTIKVKSCRKCSIVPTCKSWLRSCSSTVSQLLHSHWTIEQLDVLHSLSFSSPSKSIVDNVDVWSNSSS